MHNLYLYLCTVPYKKDLEKFADITSYLHICIESTRNNFLISNYVQNVYSAMV
jgi:hypothetical protein